MTIPDFLKDADLIGKDKDRDIEANEFFD